VVLRRASDALTGHHRFESIEPVPGGSEDPSSSTMTGAAGTETSAPHRMPTLFVSHGAAFFTTNERDATHRFLVGLAGAVSELRPRGIVMISAHDERWPLRLSGPGPLSTMHDHPARSVYDYRYPGRGSVELTGTVERALHDAGLEVHVDTRRGLDHGAWVPLSLLHPSGDIPVAQLSLAANRSPQTHVALGEALAPLRDEAILLIGSGGVTHNQEVFRSGFFGGADITVPQPFSRELDAWVSSIVTREVGRARTDALAASSTHPLWAQAHPSNEHFLPLVVVAAAGGTSPGRKVFEGFQHSLSTSAFLFGP
jgi:4,5-DOPA dioxygenase extradiol